MKTVRFNVCCNATYRSSLDLPDDVNADDIDEVLDYIRNNLDECSIHDLEWLSDYDNTESAVTAEDIISIN